MPAPKGNKNASKSEEEKNTAVIQLRCTRRQKSWMTRQAQLKPCRSLKKYIFEKCGVPDNP